jgi:hypothetical protein
LIPSIAIIQRQKQRLRRPSKAPLTIHVDSVRHVHDPRNPATKEDRLRAGDGATDGEEEVDVVELDIEAGELPLTVGLDDVDDGDTTDSLLNGGSELLEGGGPGEGEGVAVEGAVLFDLDGEVIGLSILVLNKAGGVEDGEAGVETIGGDQDVDGVGEVEERRVDVLLEVGAPVGKHSGVDTGEVLDVTLAQALLGLEGDITAVDAHGGGGSTGREGEGGEETHLEGCVVKRVSAVRKRAKISI